MQKCSVCKTDKNESTSLPCGCHTYRTCLVDLWVPYFHSIQYFPLIFRFAFTRWICLLTNCRAALRRTTGNSLLLFAKSNVNHLHLLTADCEMRLLRFIGWWRCQSRFRGRVYVRAGCVFLWLRSSTAAPKERVLKKGKSQILSRLQTLFRLFYVWFFFNKEAACHGTLAMRWAGEVYSPRYGVEWLEPQMRGDKRGDPAGDPCRRPTYRHIYLL